jgi:hypothetical protein
MDTEKGIDIKFWGKETNEKTTKKIFQPGIERHLKKKKEESAGKKSKRKDLGKI